MAERWSDADRELVAGVLHQEGCEDPCPGNCANDATAVLNALADAGWEPRCDCDGVAHDLPILRSHMRGEPGCTAHANPPTTEGGPE